MKTALVCSILASMLASGPAHAAGKVSYKTVTRKNLCRFEMQTGWKLQTSWTAAVPNAKVEKDSTEGPLQISVAFYPEGNKEFASLDAYKEQASRPNFEFEKQAEPRKSVEVDGKAAESVHIEMLSILWATTRMGPKRKVFKDLVMGNYPGGFYVLEFTSPDSLYEAERKEFERFVSKFKLLKPKSKTPPPAASSTPTVQTSTSTP